MDLPLRSYKKRPLQRNGPFVVIPKLAVTSVNGLTLVLFAAPCSLLDELLARLGESIAEVTTAAETHLGERLLDMRLNDHWIKGEEVDGRDSREDPLRAQACILERIDRGRGEWYSIQVESP